MRRQPSNSDFPISGWRLLLQFASPLLLATKPQKWNPSKNAANQARARDPAFISATDAARATRLSGWHFVNTQNCW
jgi:hypothetical protein